jgi:hypothetical protein
MLQFSSSISQPCLLLFIFKQIANNRVNGPVAALVVETDLTLLVFAGAGVVVVFVVILGAIFACRRGGSAPGHGMLKYSLHPPQAISGKTNGTASNGFGSVLKRRD